MLLAATVVAGLASRRFPDTVPDFFAEHAGDALWTLASYLFLALLFARARIREIAAAALAVSFLVEFSQLLDWPWLAAARRTAAGGLLLGHGFLGIDLVRYLAGTTIGIALDLTLTRRNPRAKTSPA